MKVLIIEDSQEKQRAITEHLLLRGIKPAEILYAKNMTDFAARLSEDIDLFIIDFNLPSIEEGAASQNGKAILETIVKSGKQDALLLAISSYPEHFPELRSFYESHGCILADFKNKKGWQSTLDHLVIQLNKKLKFDFLVFCALEEERAPYIALFDGDRVIRNDIDCYDIDIGSKKGSVVLMPDMGLVNAAITAAVCIDRFRPKIVGMSGICGGFEKNAQMGQLLISSMVYEYQSGKWSFDGFKNAPYQVSTDNGLLTQLKIIAAREELVHELEKGYKGLHRPSKKSQPKASVFTSGSAVIASQSYLDQISSIHRKVGGLDMEIYAVQRAAQLSPSKPICICAKTVVDLGNEEKGDDLHDYGSFISARFLTLAIQEIS